MDCGCRTLAGLLMFLLLLSGLSCSEVLMDPKTQAILGHAVTLPCHFVGPGQVTQVTWVKVTDLGSHTVAVRSLEHGSSMHHFYRSRAHFQVTTSDPDASLVIQDATLDDAGHFRCKIVTFPSGSFEKDTWLTVLVPPQVSVVPGPRALLEGDRHALAATCRATGSSPRAKVNWVTEVVGETKELSTENVNGTVTISSSFYLDPVRAMQGHKLTCLVNHTTFNKPARLDYQINVYYVPEVSITKSSENWYVGMEQAELTCEENGNPPATSFAWRRLQDSLPSNSEMQGNKLVFNGSMSIEDSGTYVCEATNTIGTRNGQAEIKITDPTVSNINMPSIAFVAIGVVGVLLLVISIVAVVAVNHHHRKKTAEMVFKMEEISTMSRQPSIRRCNSMSASVDARLQDGGGSRENDLEQDPMLQEALTTLAQQQQHMSSTRDLQPVNGEGPLLPPAFGNHRYSLRSTTSETHATPGYQFGSYRSSLTNSLRPSGRERTTGPSQRFLPPPIPLSNHRDSARDVTGSPEQPETVTGRNLTPSPSVPDSQTEDEEEVMDRQQSIHAAMGHFYSHNGTLRAKANCNGIYIARREHCV